MKEYGIIENGYLTSKRLEAYAEKFRDENGELQERTVTVEQQEVVYLRNGWKPVESLNESRVQCGRDGYIIRIIPYDAGDHIAYEYKEVFDIQKIKREIISQKEFLSGSDYKISKCYEASLLGESLPYDLIALHSERQAARDKVNELEAIVVEMDYY